jgi:hypothetical protein
MFLSKENDFLLIHDFDKFDELTLNKVDDLVERPFSTLSKKQTGQVGIEKNLLYTSSPYNSKNNNIASKEIDKKYETPIKNKNLNCHDIKANQTKLSKIFMEIRLEALCKNKEDQEQHDKKANSPNSHLSPDLAMHKQKTFSLGHLLNIKSKTIDSLAVNEDESFRQVKESNYGTSNHPIKKINSEWERTTSNRNSLSNFDSNNVNNFMCTNNKFPDRTYKLSDLYDPLFNPLTSSKILNSLNFKQSKVNTNENQSRSVTNFQKTETNIINMPLINQNHPKNEKNPNIQHIHPNKSSLNSNINFHPNHTNFVSISNPIFKTDLKIKANKKCPTLTEKEKKKLLKIYRQGINLEQYLPSDTKKVNKTSKSKRPLTSLLTKPRDLQTQNKYDEEKRNEELDISIENKFKKVTELRTKCMKNNMEAMKKDIVINYDQLFQLAKQERFSKEYQVNHDVIDFEKDEQLQKLINNMISKKFDFRSEMDNIFNKQMQNEEKSRKKSNAIRWRRCIITAAIHFKRLNLTIQEFYEGKHEPIKALENEGTWEFIQAVKDGDYGTVNKKLQENKLYVHEYDYVRIKRN